MKNNRNTNEQMELTFNASRACPSTERPHRRMTRARWWFQQMREAVDRAVDWKPVPPARPEQIYFPE